MKVIVFGQSPARTGFSKSIKRLYQWLEFMGYGGVVSFDNVDWDGKIDHGRIKDTCASYKKVIALGQVAHDVLRRVGVDHYHLPHPSGLNRQNNYPSLISARLAECTNYLQE